jgi:catechol 2,3-dioxygenase-like lactoylglutathione lyase family enzyme
MTVPDLDAAVRWYRDVLGFQVIAGPLVLRRGEGHAGVVAADVFGPDFGALRQAHLAGANGTGLELFEFLEPATRRRADPFEYWKTGLMHLCVIDSDPDALVDHVRRTGGRLRGARVWDLFPGEPFRMAYCEDPFGNVFEVYSHSYERTFANRSLTEATCAP